MAQRSQKIRKTPSGDWLYCSFSAHPQEIERWRGIAADDQRSLSSWIRIQLNKAAGITNGAAPVEVAEKA
jgi:hypothetical protein